MSYPYLSDLINHYFGTHWHIPIAMFGSFVALAFMIATAVGKQEVMRFEKLKLLPQATIAPNVFIPAHQIISDLAMHTALFGLLGARFFHILEHPAEFWDDPINMLLSRGGFTIYGGLIFGVIAGTIYLKKRSLPIIPMLDALAPAMILGYGIGRLGCQVSGDGDWGILANIALQPSWLPNDLWAQTYENNIVGVIIPSPGVYPTPLYEFLLAVSIFACLWLVRKTRYAQGFIFSMYLLLSGFERLLIEKIRINSQYHLWGASFTQAEFISSLLILIGLFGFLKSTSSKRIPKIAFSVLILGALSACAKI